MLLLHSYQYIDNSKLKNLTISSCQTKILNDNKILIGLCNLPNNINYYKVKLEYINENENQFYNIIIKLDVNYDKLYNIVMENKTIPNKETLLSLLKRNIINKQIIYNQKSLETLKNIKSKNCIFYKDNIIALKDILINLDTKQFFIENIELYQTSININGLILIGLTNYNYFKKYFCSKQTIILSFKKYIPFLNLIFDKKIYNIIDISKLNNQFDYNITYDLLILYNVNDKSYINVLKKIKKKSKVFLYDILDSNDYTDYMDLFLEQNISLENQYNMELFKEFIFYIKSSKNKLITKSIKLNSFEKKYLKEIEDVDKNKYLSLPNNYIHYNYVYKLDFMKQNKNKKFTCSICLDTISLNNLSFTKCKHYFCRTCIYKSLKTSSKCPNCRRKIDIFSINILINIQKTLNGKITYIINNKQKNLLVISSYNNTINNLKNIIYDKQKLYTIDIIKLNNIDKLIKSKRKYEEVIFMDIDHFNFTYYYNKLNYLMPLATYKYLCSK